MIPEMEMGLWSGMRFVSIAARYRAFQPRPLLAIQARSMAKPTPRLDPAALRQQLGRLERSLHRLLGVFFDTRHRMMRGSFVVVGKKCGKPNCACARGEAHPTRYLSWSEEGRTRIAYVSAQSAATVREAANRYQRFRAARAELVKLCGRFLEVVDSLAEALIDPYPPPRGGETKASAESQPRGAERLKESGDGRGGGRGRRGAGGSGPPS